MLGIVPSHPDAFGSQSKIGVVQHSNQYGAGKLTTSPCLTCKRRKVQCDRTFPTCLRCEWNETRCKYEQKSSKPKLRFQILHTASNDTGGSNAAHFDSGLGTPEASASEVLFGILDFSTSSSTNDPRSSTPRATDKVPGRKLEKEKHDGHHAENPKLTIDNIPIWSISSEEHRNIQFFHERSYPSILALNPTYQFLYSTLVPQACFKEAAIRNQMIAIAQAHQATINRDFGARTKSLTYLGRAFKELASIGRDDDKMHVVLMFCLLMVSFHLLQRNDSPGVDHIRHGLRILEEREAQLKQNERLTASDAIVQKSLAHLIKNNYANLSDSRNTPVVRSQINLPPIILRAPAFMDSTTGFTCLATTRRTLEDMGDWLVSLPPGSHESAMSALRPRWHNMLITTIPWVELMDSQTLLYAKLVNCYFKMGSIAAQCTGSSEMDWDRFVNAFRAQVAVSKEVLTSVSGRKDITGFLKEPGTGPVLWQVAMKCREPLVRKEAIKLLRTQGVCNGRRAGNLRECLLLAETISRLEDTSDDDGGVRQPAPCLVEEKRRIRVFDFDPGNCAHGVVTLSWWPYSEMEMVTVAFDDLCFTVFDTADMKVKVRM